MRNASFFESGNHAAGSRSPARPAAFTLVELLVVIGIIALLIGILLPSLQAARRSAQRTACAAKLHQIMLAAQMHRQEHLDYYPLVGVLPDCTPEALDDQYRRKYDYYNGGVSANGQILCPITYALETEMQGGNTLYGPNGLLGTTSYNQDTAMMLDPHGLNMNFICPAQAASPLDVQPMYVYLWVASTGSYVCQPQSYVFNEYICGWNDTYGSLRGKGSLIHQPAATMFAMDGLGGSTLANHQGAGLKFGTYTVYTMTTQFPVTLADAYTAPTGFGQSGIAGDRQNFDTKRHSGKINIAFCDGHVETRNLNPTGSDLRNVYIAAP